MPRLRPVFAAAMLIAACLAAASVAGLGQAPPAAARSGAARAAPPVWNGTWAGLSGRETLQVIVAGAEPIGLFWNRDYAAIRSSSVGPDGASMTILTSRGQVVLSRPDGRSLRATVTGAGRAPLTITLARD